MKELDLARAIDQTKLTPTTSFSDFRDFCELAADHHFASVAMLPIFIETASSVLKTTDTKVCAAISYPLSAVPPELKAAEVKNAILRGADEIDYVMNIGALKNREYELLLEEARQIISVADGRVVKVIIEMWALTEIETQIACDIGCEAGVTFIKSSTGYQGHKGIRGSSIEDAALLLKLVDGRAQVKIAGGIKDVDLAIKLLNMGIVRLGTSSGVQIMEGYKQLLAGG